MKVLLPIEVTEYVKEAKILHDLKRRERLDDKKLLNSLEVLLKTIDTSAMSEKEIDKLESIISKYRV